MKTSSRALGLRARATLAWGVIALLLSSSLSLFAYEVTRGHLLDERKTNALNQAFLNARLVRNTLRAGEPLQDALPSLVGGAQSTTLVRVGGEWLSESVAVSPRSLPSAFLRATSNGGAVRQTIELDNEPFIAIGVGIPSYRAQYFEIVAMEDIQRTLTVLAQRLTLMAALATLVGALIGWLASGRILKPLSQFTSAAEKIAAGGLDTRIEAEGDRDLLTLARSFNRMADAVQQRIDREARFTSQVSHELRSPVAALFSVINVARRKLTRRDPDEVLDDMEGRVRHLHSLVEDLLELSRVDAGVSKLQLEPIDLVEFVKSQLGGSNKADVDFVVEPDGPVLLHADKRRLGQVFQNLLENAERYAGGVTAIHIDAKESRVRVAVDDDGPGVPEAERDLLFERFSRGEAAMRSHHNGAGLGLSLVAEHLALHGGTVRYSERPAGGSRFVLELPMGIGP